MLANTGWNIRAAAEADVAAVVECINSAFLLDAYYCSSPERTDADEVLSCIRAAPTTVFGCFEQSGTVIGAIVYNQQQCPDHPDSGHIGMVSVRPGHQKKGIGRALVAACERVAGSEGRVFLEASLVNLVEHLPHVYASYGFVQQGDLEQPEHMKFWIKPEFLSKVGFLHYVKRLDSAAS